MRPKAHGAVKAITVGTSATQICGPSEKRIALLFSPPLSPNTYTISTESSVTAATGISLTSAAPPIKITRAEFGDAVCKAWYGIAPVAITIAFLETVEE